MDEPTVSGGSDASAAPASTRQRVREVFGSGGFRRLFAARAISQFGDGLFQFAAAAVLLFDDPGPNPAMRLAGIVAVTLIPFSLVSPFTGVFIDRWERRKILQRVPLLRAVVAATLWPAAAVFGVGSMAFYVVVLIVLSANRFFLATMSAVLPQLVPRDDLLVANAAASTGGAIANVSGQFAGATLSAAIGGQPTAMIAAGAFALTALAARRIPVHRGLLPEKRPILDEVREILGEMVDGAREVSRDARVMYGLSAIGLTQFLIGAITAVLVYAFIAELGLAVGAAGVVLAVLAVGIGTGVVLVPVAAKRVPHDRLIPASFFVAALGVALAIPAMTRSSLIVAAGLIGAAYAFVKIPVDTIVQEEMRDVVRGRAFALYDMLFNVTRVAGVITVAFAYEVGASSTALVSFVAVAYAGAGFAFASRGRGQGMFHKRRQGEPRATTPTFSVGEIVAVRSYAGSRADEEPRALLSQGQEVPITSVDWRAVVEEHGRRSRVFVVRTAAQRLRLAFREDEGAWEIERILPEREDHRDGVQTKQHPE